MNFWNNFAAKHPAAAKWVREGGLFVIVSNLITLFKYLLLQSNQYPRNQLFIRNSILFQAIGNHIIYILDKDNIGIQIIQVLNQRAVPPRTEQQLAFIA